MATNQNQNSSTITGDVKSRIDKIWDTLEFLCACG